MNWKGLSFRIGQNFPEEDGTHFWEVLQEFAIQRQWRRLFLFENCFDPVEKVFSHLFVDAQRLRSGLNV
jgi:hypothetical protein